MPKKIHKTDPIGSRRPVQQRSIDRGIASQRIREILAQNGVPVDSIKPRYLSDFIDRIIESLTSGRAINKDSLELGFRKEVLQKQQGIDKRQVNMGRVSISINELKNNLPAAPNDNLSEVTALSHPPSGNFERAQTVQARTQLQTAEETVIQKIIGWAEHPPEPREIYTSPGYAKAVTGTETKTIVLPKRTNPEAELSELIRQSNPAELQRRIPQIANTITWYIDRFIPAQSGITNKVLNGEPVQGREMIEQLDPVFREIDPDFDISKLINADTVITQSDRINVGNEINNKILMPRGVFASSVEGGQHVIGFILKDPELLTTPRGRSMPLYKVYPFIGEFGTAYSDHGMIIYPYCRDVDFARTVKTIQQNWLNYKIGAFRGVSFRENPNFIVSWIAIHFFEGSHDIVKDQRTDTINEELAHHDLQTAFREKEGLPFETYDIKRKVSGIKKLLKPDSILLRELENIVGRTGYSREADDFCSGINEMYAKLVSLEKSPFPSFTLMDCILNSITTRTETLAREDEQYPTARKFLAQFIWKELNSAAELNSPTHNEWAVFFDNNIKGTDEASDKEAIRAFNKRLVELSPKIVSEHFTI